MFGLLARSTLAPPRPSPLASIAPAPAVVMCRHDSQYCQHAAREGLGLLHGGCTEFQPSAIFRIQLKRFLAAAEALPLFDFVDLGGSPNILRAEEVRGRWRVDERGLANMRLMRKTFGEDQSMAGSLSTR